MIAVDRVDVNDRHVETAERPDHHLKPDKQAQPLVGLAGDYMGSHWLVKVPVFG